MDDFVKDLKKLEKIISLSIDIDEKQKQEWINIINSLKNSNNFNFENLINEITSIDINAYNTVFQKKVHKLTKKDIIKYSTLALNYMQNKSLDNTLAFLENFNINIHKVKPSYVNRIQKLKEKKGFLYVRQRSLSITKDKIISENIDVLKR